MTLRYASIFQDLKVVTKMTALRGKFVWYELMTTDPKAATAFYNNVAGWGARDANVPGMAYTLFTLGEMPVAGMMAIPKEATGLRPAWIGYVGVDDVDKAARDVAQMGGVIHREAQDIPDIGRFAIVADPQGVMLALFKPLPAGAQEPVDPRIPGRTGWHELHATDGVAAFAFYEKLFGWTKGDANDMGPMGIYQHFKHDGAEVGGIMTKLPQEPAPYWLYYTNVSEINAAVERVKAGGGQVISGPLQVPGGPMIAHCLDPQDAVFALVEPR
jgi:predicted enzyme related to lactoylglutathione lyase